MSALTGYAYPVPEPSDDAPGRFRRKWVLRLRDAADEEPVFARVINELREGACKSISEAYGEPGSRPENMPSVHGVRVDANHIVVEIDCPRADVAVGDMAAIATWSVLRGVDKRWCIEDVEGIPKRYWFALH